MPFKNGHLTPKERVWADQYAATGDATYAATKAGYSSPQQRGVQNTQNPALIEESRKLQNARLMLEALPLAVDQLITRLKDPKTSGNTVATLIGLTFKHGFAAADAAASKDPSEMTPDEIADARGKMLARLANLTAPTPVTIEVEANPIEVDSVPEDGIFE